MEVGLTDDGYWNPEQPQGVIFDEIDADGDAKFATRLGITAAALMGVASIGVGHEVDEPVRYLHPTVDCQGSRTLDRVAVSRTP